MNKHSVALLLTLCSYLPAVQTAHHQPKKQKSLSLEQEILARRALEAAQETKLEILNGYLEQLRILRHNPTNRATIAQLLTPLEQSFKSKELDLNLFDAGYAFTDQYGKSLGYHILKLLDLKYADQKIAQKTINALIKPLHVQASRHTAEEIVTLYPEHHGFFTSDETRFKLDHNH